MLIAALVLGAGLGMSGSSGLGSDGVLRVNMEGPRGSVAGTLGELTANTAFVVELCLPQEGFPGSWPARAAQRAAPVPP